MPWEAGSLEETSSSYVPRWFSIHIFLTPRNYYRSNPLFQNPMRPFKKKHTFYKFKRLLWLSNAISQI